jgi:Protein of unknown function (DUF3592)
MTKRSISLARSSAGNQQKSAGCAIAFGAVFALFGSIFVTLFLLLPLWRTMNASNWVAVPCTILESRVGESHSDGSTTYRVEVRYRYQFDATALEAGTGGQFYESDIYDVTHGMSSSGRGSKEDIVRTLPPGTETTCYVNPNNPSEAILVRNFPDTWWVGLLTLIFPLAGLGVMYFGFRLRRQQRLMDAGLLPRTDSVTDRPLLSTHYDETPDQELKPVSSRLKTLLGMGFFALFWNGFSWGILLFVILPEKDPDYFPIIFLSVFCLIGLGLLAYLFTLLLAYSNPSLRLILSKRVLRPGETLALSWDAQGNVLRADKMTLKIEGRESATYRRGTKTHTDTKVFATYQLKELLDTSDMLSGKLTYTLPKRLAPSFNGNNNKIGWFLIVTISVPRWPDSKDEYLLTVAPPRTT